MRDDERDPSADLYGTDGGASEPHADAIADQAAARDAGPSDAERRGLGDIGELGDEAATGQVGLTDEAPESEAPERLGAGGTMGFDTEPAADVERSRAARQGGGPLETDGGGEDDITPERGTPPR